MIAPIIIVVIIVFYYLFITFFLIRINFPLLLKVTLIGIPLIVILTLLFVLRERIIEIKKGEEDDLSKY